MKIKYTKVFSLLVISLISLQMLTGCWNRKELTELAIVGAISIDKSSENVNIAYEIIKAKSKESKGGDESPVYYLQSEGETVFDANRNATLKSDKKLFWPHINMIYLNTKLAEDGLFKYIDYFNRNHESRKYVNLAVTKDTNAYEILSLDGSKEIPSSYVEKLFENYSSNGKSVSTKLLDFLKTYYTEGIEPVVGVISSTKRIEGKTEGKEGGKESKKEENLVPTIEGLAVFKDDKFIGFFDGSETRGYNFITNKLKSCLIVSPSPDGLGENSVEIITSSSKIKVEIKEEKYYATVEIKINGMLGGETGKEAITNPEVIKKIEESNSNIVKNEIEKSIQKAKQYRSDIFGFGQAIHISDHKKWKEIKDKWNEEFTNIIVDTKVKTSLQRVGMENQQLSANESR